MTYPLIAEVVGLASQSGNTLDGYELARQRLPEVHTILFGVKAWVDLGDKGLVVGNGEDIAVIKTAVLLPGRLDILLANDARGLALENDSLDLIVAGHNADVGRVDDLGEVDVVFVGAVLSDVTIDGDEVADCHVSEGITAKDVDAANVRLTAVM